MRRRTLLALMASISIVGCGEPEVDNPDDLASPEEGTPTSEQTPGNDAVSTDEEETPDEQREEYVNRADGQVELVFGDTARVENGVEVTIHGISLEETSGGEEPEERDLFAFLEIESYNNSDDERRLPDQTDPDLYLLYGDQQVSPTFRFGAFSDSEYDVYEGGNVQGGVRREGYILFEVDEGYEGEIDFLWQDEFFVASDVAGDIDVRWTPE